MDAFDPTRFHCIMFNFFPDVIYASFSFLFFSFLFLLLFLWMAVPTRLVNFAIKQRFGRALKSDSLEYDRSVSTFFLFVSEGFFEIL